MQRSMIMYVCSVQRNNGHRKKRFIMKVKAKEERGFPEKVDMWVNQIQLVHI